MAMNYSSLCFFILFATTSFQVIVAKGHNDTTPSTSALSASPSYSSKALSVSKNSSSQHVTPTFTAARPSSAVHATSNTTVMPVPSATQTINPNKTQTASTNVTHTPSVNSTVSSNATVTTTSSVHTSSIQPTSAIQPTPTKSSGKHDEDYDNMKKRMWVATSFAIIFAIATVVLAYLVYRQRKINKELEGDPSTSRLL